jgi:hypothetical protein
MKAQKIGDSYRFEFPPETITPVPLEAFEQKAGHFLSDRSEKRTTNQLRSMCMCL